MSLPAFLRVEAQTDFDEAFDYYENQRRGLGVDFAGKVQECLDRIAANPDWYGVTFADIRQAMLKRFPYFICYRVHPAHVEVIAVMHTSRNPSSWQRRA
jgi:plasmid stabilization system protein ParE